MGNLNSAPNANRVRIGFFGSRNAGKSSLVNAFAGQEVSIVSDTPGTTTDPVVKAMELCPSERSRLWIRRARTTGASWAL